MSSKSKSPSSVATGPPKKRMKADTVFALPLRSSALASMKKLLRMQEVKGIWRVSDASVYSFFHNTTPDNPCITTKMNKVHIHDTPFTDNYIGMAIEAGGKHEPQSYDPTHETSDEETEEDIEISDPTPLKEPITPPPKVKSPKTNKGTPKRPNPLTHTKSYNRTGKTNNRRHQIDGSEVDFGSNTMWYVADCPSDALEQYNSFISLTYGVFSTPRNNKSTYTIKIGDDVSLNYYVREGLFHM
jgi:hypothetical protein